MDKKPNGLSLITNGSFNGKDSLSSFPYDDRRDSVELSPTSPTDKRLFPGPKKHKTKFQRLLFIGYILYKRYKCSASKDFEIESVNFSVTVEIVIITRYFIYKINKFFN